MRIYCRLAVLWVAFLSFFTATSQNSYDTSVAYAKAVQLYHQSLSPETGLYNGIEYVDYAYSIQEGTPFFGYTPFDAGSVMYDGMLYRNVPLAFDIVKDAVVIYDEAKLHKIVLNNRYVSSFTASSQPFIHLTKDSAGAADMMPGFYEVLYDGQTRVLKKEKRTVQDLLSSVASFSKRYVTYSSDYFIRKGNAYHSINSQAAMLSFFGDQKKDIQKDLKRKKLKFKRNKEGALAEAALYYDTVTK